MSTEIVFRSAPAEQTEEGRFYGNCDTHLWHWVYQHVFDDHAIPYAEVRLHREDLLNLKERLADVTEKDCNEPYLWEQVTDLKVWVDRILRDFNFTQKRLTVTIVS